MIIMRNKQMCEDLNDEFLNIVWWMQENYTWDHVETEGSTRVRFDWNGNRSFWLYCDGTTDGILPKELSNELKKRGIKKFETF